MNVIKFHTGRFIGNFIEVPSGSLDDVLFNENKCFNLKIKYNISINNNVWCLAKAGINSTNIQIKNK